MTDAPRPEGQDAELIEVGASALWNIRLQPHAGLSSDDIRRRNAEAVIEAVRPIVEQRLRDDYFDPDADGEQYKSCDVCGKPVMYGSRHWQCGDSLQRIERETKRAVLEQIKQEYGGDWISDYRREYPDEPIMPVSEMVDQYLAALEATDAES